MSSGVRPASASVWSRCPRSIDAVDVVELRVFLVAEPGVDDHRPHAAHDERPHRERDAVAIVGRRLPRPQRLRHDAEHRAAVEAEEAVVQRDQLEIAERIARIRVTGVRLIEAPAVPDARGTVDSAGCCRLFELDQHAVRARRDG